MDFDSYGTLTVRTTLADESIPLENCVVIITGSGDNNSAVKHSVLTDEDGVTPKVPLPTPSKIYSLAPNPAESAYAVYDVKIIKDGFYTKNIRDVAVFSGVDSILPVNMLPFVSYYDGGSYPRGNVNALITENEHL